MALPMALMAAGTALQMYGTFQANIAQARAERQNRDFYNQQAEFAQEATFREAELSRRNYARARGLQLSAFAKGGVDISGSAASVIAGTFAKEIEEQTAIKRKGDLDYRLARLRGAQSAEKADTLESFGYNFLQGGGSLLTNYASYAKAEAT